MTTYTVDGNYYGSTASDGTDPSRTILDDFANIADAETFARRLCQSRGDSFMIIERHQPPSPYTMRIIAVVRRDASERVWTDLNVIEAVLL